MWIKLLIMCPEFVFILLFFRSRFLCALIHRFNKIMKRIKDLIDCVEMVKKYMPVVKMENGNNE